MPFTAPLAALVEVPDPRRAQGQRHSTRHQLLFSALATLAGATSCQKIVAFIALQRERLNAVLDAGFRRAPAVSTLRRANGVQNVGLALHHANTVSFDRLLALGTA